MCYSAQVEQSLKTLGRSHKARVAIEPFERLFEQRLEDDSIKIPKGLEANFYAPETAGERRIHDLIRVYQARRTKELEEGLFKQRKRLADAERALAQKETKAAAESSRIAKDKLIWHLEKLANLKRTTPQPEDSRIFPFHYAPVVISEGGDNVILPMRYHCRPVGKPAFYDRKYDGLYNARRDNLEGFWKGQFGVDHAIVVMTSFYENVARHDAEHRALAPGEKPENLVLHFVPRPATPMNVACLWSHWQEPGKRDLYSFAAITDDPPSEVAAAGHDRCVVPLKVENVSAWLHPQRQEKKTLYALLDDRERPYYEHRVAA